MAVGLLRDPAHLAEHRVSVARRMDESARQPRYLPEYVTWLRTEFAKETPDRLHERGVEPESAIGSPRLSGAFRAYLMGSPFATDHDDRLDLDMRDATYVRPIHRALAVMAKRRPRSAQLLFEMAWSGADWEDLVCQRHLVPEFGAWVVEGALAHLWSIWARGIAGRP